MQHGSMNFQYRTVLYHPGAGIGCKELNYTLLHTNISRKKMSAVQAFMSDDKPSKHSLGCKEHLRLRIRTTVLWNIQLHMAGVHDSQLDYMVQMIKLENTELSHVGVKPWSKMLRIRGFVIGLLMYQEVSRTFG